jgi:uncharacterized sulfatase
MEAGNYVVLFKRFSLLVIIYSLCRALFLFFNYSYFEDVSSTSLFQAFLLGIRFDLASLSLLNSLFILFSIIPFKNISGKSYQKFLKILYLSSNIPFILLNLIDLEYFKFRGRRTTYDVVGIAGDIKDQSLQLIGHYWYILLFIAGLIYLLIRFYPEYEERKIPLLLSWKTNIPAFLIIVSLSFVSFRGIGLKPIRPNNAFVLSPNKLGNLVLNTPFVFLLTLEIKGLEKVNYFPDQKEALSLIVKDPIKESEAEIKDNVVIIILESFASEYLGIGNNYQGYTPFLDSLAGKGLFFRNNFANGRQSIEALPSIMASIPSLMDEPFNTSIYQTNKIIGLGNILKKEGYRTSFFHGGKNGTMGFDAFSRNAGFEEYFGLNEYPEKEKDYDGNWGIFDEPFLQFFAKKLGEFKQPFLTGVFTLSSHQPYTIPVKYKNKFPKGELDVHESIGYADYALRKFFETASHQPWFNSTLFVITADHTQMNSRKEYGNVIGNYRVPLIFYHPGKKLPDADTSQVTQHCDIMPSILDYLNIPVAVKLHFGRSVFDRRYQGEALNYSNSSYRLIAKKYFLEFSPEKGASLYDLTSDREQQNPLHNMDSVKVSYENKIKAYIQYYNNGLIENNWY